uniref:Uncharacterized protein n=1 Tax=Oryza nivara TaxID=4536 RepID=A0A0E0HXF8_ORYNI
MLALCTRCKKLLLQSKKGIFRLSSRTALSLTDPPSKANANVSATGTETYTPNLAISRTPFDVPIDDMAGAGREEEEEIPSLSLSLSLSPPHSEHLSPSLDESAAAVAAAAARGFAERRIDW